jgi:MinD-like ATPase involved in chromosome partitioning or flagellar assembly
MTDTESTPRHAVLASLADRFPAHAVGIRSSDKLRDAVDELMRSTGLDADRVDQLIGERDLDGAKKPIEVLIGRCKALATEHAPTPVHTAATAPPSAPSLDSPVVSSAAQPWWQRSLRRGASVTPPTVAGPMAERVALPIIGNRYLTIMGVTGGAGTSTMAALVGQVLATCRSDRVVLADGAALPGGAGSRAGVSAGSGMRRMLADETNIHGLPEMHRFVSRTPSRLDVAPLAMTDDPLSADEYRRATTLLSRYYDVQVTDAGATTSADAVSPILGMSDLVVLVVPPTAHGLRSAEHRLGWLSTNGGVGPARLLVAVNGIHRRSPVSSESIQRVVGPHCASFTTIPWDPHLAIGDAVDLRTLHSLTLQAVTGTAAALVEALRISTDST